MGILLYSFYKCITIQTFRLSALYLMSLFALTHRTLLDSDPHRRCIAQPGPEISCLPRCASTAAHTALICQQIRD